MTTSHVFYIPLVLLAGFVLGLLLGRRSIEAETEVVDAREARRAARRKRLAELDAQRDASETAP